MKLIKEREIYLDKKRLLRQMRQIEVVQYDSGVQLVFNVMDFDIPSGTTATIYFQKPSGKCVFQECDTLVEENKITIDVENQAFTEYGFVSYQVKLIKDSSVISSFIGNIAVEKSLADANAVESKTVITAFEEVTAEKIAEIEKAADENNLASSIICEAEGTAIGITDASNRTLKGLNVYGNTTQSGTPTPENPIDLDSVVNPTVTINGKNLLNNTATTQTVNGVTFTVNADGTVTANGTATLASWYDINTNLTLPLGKYILSGCPNGGSETTYDLRYGSLGANRDTGNGATITISEPAESYVAIIIRSGVTVDNLTFNPMIRFATITDTTYEPYKSQTLSVPYTLNGVGDVKDYVDFERGVLVQKCAKIRLTSSMSWGLSANQHRIYAAFSNIYPSANTPILCSHFKNGNWLSTEAGTVAWGNNAFPVCGVSKADFATVDEFKSWLDSQTDGVFIVVPLVTPTETPLTAEELEAFKQLTTYYPTTTIINSENAEMGVSYCADTKLYIDNKFNELQNAILSQGANV